MTFRMINIIFPASPNKPVVVCDMFRTTKISFGIKISKFAAIPIYILAHGHTYAITIRGVRKKQISRNMELEKSL